MKTNFLNYLANKIAAFYWAYLKKAIDSYVQNLQKDTFLNFGKNVSLIGSGKIFHPENISIGDYVYISENYLLMGIGGIEIGDGTMLGKNVCIQSGNHDFKSYDYIPFNDNYDKRKIVIGKGVWMGQNVSIIPGITIGDGAIIGMGVTVSKDVAKGEIIVGLGNRSLGTRDIEKLDKLIEARMYTSKHISKYK